MDVLASAYVQLDPAAAQIIGTLVTALVSFLILQLTNVAPWLAEYLGQYKVGIVTWLTGLVIQLVQAGLDKVPMEWDAVAALAVKLIIEVAIVLLGFAVYRKTGAKGSKALLPS